MCNLGLRHKGAIEGLGAEYSLDVAECLREMNLAAVLRQKMMKGNRDLPGLVQR